MRLVYRPEIDGLRAIAVVGVIIYHADILIYDRVLLPGGFIGVDIFFVISGYLITSLIVKELITTNKFSFSNFYERRCRRILPALFTVMLISSPIAFLYLSPVELLDYARSVLFSLVFSSNLYFHYSGLQYGAVEGLLKPFLHTWSLSVEEQFYLLFPLFIVLFFKFARKYLPALLCLGIIVSLVLSHWGSYNHPSINFYVLPTRGWELLAGSLLAYWEQYVERGKGYISNYLFPFLGLMFIIIAVVGFDDKMPLPSLYSVLPILGVMLLIWYSGHNDWTTKLLSSRPFVATGLISYSLYLWHYPVFAFCRVIFEETITDMILVGLMAPILLVGLSVLSYRYIEIPFRNRDLMKRSQVVSILATLLGILVIIHMYVLFNNGLPDRVPYALVDVIDETPQSRLTDLEGKTCWKRTKDFCNFNDSGSKEVFLIGDSLVASLNLELSNLLIDNGYEVTIMNVGACPYLPGFDRINTDTEIKHHLCHSEYQDRVRDTLMGSDDSIILLGGHWSVYIDGILQGEPWNEEFQSISTEVPYLDSMRASVQELADRGHKILLLYPTPEFLSDPPMHFINLMYPNPLPFIDEEKMVKLFDSNPVHVDYLWHKDLVGPSRTFLDTVSHDNIYRIDPENLFCNFIIPDKCVAHDGTHMFFSDYLHFAPRGAELVSDLILQNIIRIDSNIASDD